MDEIDLKMFGEVGKPAFDACLAGGCVKDFLFDFSIWARITDDDEKKVYLFITQPPVRYVSIKVIASDLNLSQKRVIEVLFGILEKTYKEACPEPDIGGD